MDQKKYLSRSVSDQESKEIRELFSCLLETLNSKSTLNEERVFTVVEAQPEYIGGYGAMMAFIKENLHIRKNGGSRRSLVPSTFNLPLLKMTLSRK